MSKDLTRTAFTRNSSLSVKLESFLARLQISVNIGGDPSGISADSLTVNVQSPGMVSLNSVGTGSPIATPAPTPTPPIGISTTPQPSQVHPTSNSKPEQVSKDSSSAMSGSEAEKVIQELKPVEAKTFKTSDPQFSASMSSQVGAVASLQPSSPTKSFLTQFPVVKDKPAKGEASGGQFPEKEIVPPKDKPPAPESGKQPDLSVFDFSESRSDILVNFSKHNQTSVSKSTSSTSSSRWPTSKPFSTAAKPPPPVNVTASVQQMPPVPVSAYADKVPVSIYSDKPMLAHLSYSQPVHSSSKSSAYSGYNIPSSGNVGVPTSGNPGYHKSSGMARYLFSSTCSNQAFLMSLKSG